MCQIYARHDIMLQFHPWIQIIQENLESKETADEIRQSDNISSNDDNIDPIESFDEFLE